jgi:hypothetical protein
LLKSQKYIECLKRSYSEITNQIGFDNKWSNIVGGKFREPGKSIYIGNRVKAISQHYDVSVLAGYWRYHVSIEDGHVNHMRISFSHMDKKNRIDASFLRFDFEYYAYYLLHFYHSFFRHSNIDSNY